MTMAYFLSLTVLSNSKCIKKRHHCLHWESAPKKRERPNEELQKDSKRITGSQKRPHHEWRRHQHLWRVPQNHRHFNQVNADAYVQKHPPDHERTDRSREGNSIPPIQHQRTCRHDNGTNPLCHYRGRTMNRTGQSRTTASVPTVKPLITCCHPDAWYDTRSPLATIVLPRGGLGAAAA